MILRIDYDRPYIEDNIKKIINWIKGLLKDHVKLIIIHRSSSGRIHVWVHVDFTFSYWWQMFIQLSLNDDENRFICNMKRYEFLNETARDFDILFSRKKTITVNSTIR